MQIFVHSLQGNTLALNVNANSSVAAVKSMIQDREGKNKKKHTI
jgi:small subunit ribosomal protein S27Ae